MAAGNTTDYFDFAPEPPPPKTEVERPEGEDDPALMEPVLEALKTVQDPEIPINLVELGLIYELIVKQGRHRLCRDDVDDARLPGRREHAGRGRGGGPLPSPGSTTSGSSWSGPRPGDRDR